jgi:cell division septum initiation protein DivIVA
MADFKVIETQEQFDAAIGPRLERAKKSFETELREKGWKSPEEITALTDDLAKQIETLKNTAAETEQKLSEKDAKIAEGEKYKSDMAKVRIAIGMGLSIEDAENFKGETEEEWTASAKAVLGRYQAYAANLNRPSPLGATEQTGGSTRDQFASWLSETLN